MAMRNEDLLSGWQEIADYMDKSVRTVQRWALKRGLPVWHPAGAGSTPHSSKRLLDRWALSQFDTIGDPAPFRMEAQAVASPL